MLNLKGLKVLFRDRVLTILERKYHTDKKTRYYLFDLQDRTYISGLYPAGDNTFIFDVRDTGEAYQIEFCRDDETGNITYEISRIKNKPQNF